MNQHDNYWANLKGKAESHLNMAFGDCDMPSILGHDKGIVSENDVCKLLAYALRHGDFSEKADVIVHAMAWTQAHHELEECGRSAAEVPRQEAKERYA